jgi:hypothetical protein
MADLLLLVPALASLLLLTWAVRVQFILRQMQRDLGYAPRRRRGSNPPPPGRKPAPPAGQPEQPLQADLIRYWRWKGEQVWRAMADEPIRFDEGQAQRGNGHGGPTTPKPPIKPQFPQPRKIREDFL